MTAQISHPQRIHSGWTCQVQTALRPPLLPAGSSGRPPHHRPKENTHEDRRQLQLRVL